MAVNYCDICFQPPGCCLCWEEEPPLDDESDDEPTDRGCLNCGMCESCIDRSIAHAEEMNTFAPSRDGDYEE